MVNPGNDTMQHAFVFKMKINSLWLHLTTQLLLNGYWSHEIWLVPSYNEIIFFLLWIGHVAKIISIGCWYGSHPIEAVHCLQSWPSFSWPLPLIRWLAMLDGADFCEWIIQKSPLSFGTVCPPICHMFIFDSLSLAFCQVWLHRASLMLKMLWWYIVSVFPMKICSYFKIMGHVRYKKKKEPEFFMHCCSIFFFFCMIFPGFFIVCD